MTMFSRNYASLLRALTRLSIPGLVLLTGTPILAQETSRIEGTVRDSEGSPLPDIRVSIMNPYGQVAREIKTATDGTYVLLVQIGDGPVTIQFYDSKGIYETEWYRNASTREMARSLPLLENQTLTIDASLAKVSSPEPATTTTITGTVTDEAGEPIPEISVWVLRAADACQAFGTARPLKRAKTDQEGGYSIQVEKQASPVVVHFVDSGTLYEDEWNYDTYNCNMARRLLLESLGETVEVNASLAPQPLITGTVTNKEGKPLSGIIVSVERSGGYFGLQGVTDRSGKFWVPVKARFSPIFLLFKDADQSTKLEWYRDAPAMERAQRILLRPGETVEIHATVDPERPISEMVTIEGTVTDESGNALADIEVQAVVKGGGGAGKTMANGRYRLQDIDARADLGPQQDEGTIAVKFTDFVGSFETAYEQVTIRPGATITGVDVRLRKAAEGEEDEDHGEEQTGDLADEDDPLQHEAVKKEGGGGGRGAEAPAGAGGEPSPGPVLVGGGGGGRGGGRVSPGPGGAQGAAGAPAPGPVAGEPGQPGGPEDPSRGGRGEPEGGIGGPVPGGHARADVHMRTLDGARYDLQAAGEFVAVRAREGDMEVQLRMEPWQGSDRVSVNTAVAIRIDADRVSIVETGSTPIVRVNGAPMGLERGKETRLKNGGRIAGGDREINLTWPDGSTATVLVHQGFLDTYLSPAEARRGTLVGLLGDFDGDPSDDFVTSGGERLEGPLSFETLYGELAASWLVRPEESLFDYERGQGTETFMKPNFPSRAATTASLSPADRQRAERACRQNGVTDPDVLEECIVDVGHSGEELFARAALTAQARDRIAHARARLSVLGPEPILSGLCRPVAAATATASYSGDVAHTGRFGSALQGFRGEREWSLPGFSSGHVPLVVGQRVILGKVGGLAALDAGTGRTLWEGAGPSGRIAGRGLVAAGGTVFTSWQGAVSAHRIETGDECWRLPVANATSPAFDGGRVFASVDEGETGFVAAVDASSGRIIWRYDSRNPAPANWPNPSAPTVGAGAVFVADGKEIVSFDAGSGAVRWRMTTGNGVNEGLSYADGVVYVPDRKHGLHAIDASTGGVQWVWSETGLNLNDAVALSGELVFVADGRHLHAIDRRSGSEVWKIDAEGTVRFNTPYLVGDRLYAFTLDGDLVVLNTATGDEMQRVKVWKGYGWSAATPARGTLYFVLPNGSLVAYR